MANGPAFGSFLALLASDIEKRQETLRSFTPEFVQQVRALTQHVEFDLDAPLSPGDE